MHLLKDIEDPENFLPLPEAYHRQFDRNRFTYDENGCAVSIKGEDDYVNGSLPDKFKTIDDEFLTKKRIIYINKRNKQIY